MWKITLCLNVVALFLLWLLAQVVITPINNLFVQYAETKIAIPILTDFAIQHASLTAAIPIGWGIITLFYGWQMRKMEKQKRNEYLSLHSSATLCAGLLVILFFSLAAILPILKIGSVVF
jgi:hypothetical protein